MSKQQCIFCDIISGTIPVKTVGSTANSIAFMDAFPVAAGHVLVVPIRHYEKIQDLSETDCLDLFKLVQNMIKKVDTITGSTLVAAHNGKESGQWLILRKTVPVLSWYRIVCLLGLFFCYCVFPKHTVYRSGSIIFATRYKMNVHVWNFLPTLLTVVCSN